MILNLGCIVEGHGEVAAVPVLLHRLGQASDPNLYLNVLRSYRVGRYKLAKPGELEATVEEVARRIEVPRAILTLIDAEDDCPNPHSSPTGETEQHRAHKRVRGWPESRPPRCRNEVGSSYLPACGFPAPGGPAEMAPVWGNRKLSLYTSGS
jgi:hypothetical protein